MTATEKITSGEMPTALEWNRHVDVSEWWHGTRRLGGGGQEGIRGIPSYGHEVRLRNSSGGDVNRYDVLGINSVLIDPGTNLAEWIRAPVFTGVTPTASHVGKFAVCLEPIAPSGIRRAIVAGYTHAIINIVDTNHEACEIEVGSTRLKSAVSGTAKILYKQSGTGDKYCLIRISDSSAMLPQIGKLQASCAPGDIGTLDLYKQTGTSMPTPRSPAATIDALNITGITLHSGVFMYVDAIEQFEVPIMFPGEIEPCLQPGGGVNTQGLE